MPDAGRAMSLEGVIHCDGLECEAHAHVGVTAMSLRRLPAGWLKFSEFSDHGTTHEFAFCTGHCAMKWIASNPCSEPPKAIDV